MKLEGRVWVFQEKDNINTDILYPGEFLQQKLSDEEMAKVTFHNYDSLLTQAIENGELEGTILLWGKNAGAGSSRIQAAKGLKYNGVTAVVAESFAGIYYRSGINIGFPLITCPELIQWIYSTIHPQFFNFEGRKARPQISFGISYHTISIDFEESSITYKSPGVKQQYQFPKLPKELLEIFEAGGLIKSIRKTVERGEYNKQK